MSHSMKRFEFSEILSFYTSTLKFSDERTRGWLFVDSPLPMLAITSIYLLIVLLGPKIMKHRKPFDLRSIILPYNMGIALLNAYIAIELFIPSIALNYNYLCEPCRVAYDPHELRITKAVWWFYFSKCIEFCDSIFFVLRKKDNQLTFLHIYHHSTMFPLWWIGVKWVPSGSTFLPAMVNSGIHVLMYSYYGLSTLGPEVAKFLWWKKYLTILQLIQFTTALFLGVRGIRVGCEFPLWMHYALIFYMTSFIILFGRFYVNQYITSGKKRWTDYRANKKAL